MVQFKHNHSGMDEVDAIMKSGILGMNDTLSEINAVMRGVLEAVEGDQRTVWLERQNQWNKHFRELLNKLEVDAAASRNVDAIFRNGNTTSTRIIAGG